MEILMDMTKKQALPVQKGKHCDNYSVDLTEKVELEFQLAFHISDSKGQFFFLIIFPITVAPLSLT